MGVDAQSVIRQFSHTLVPDWRAAERHTLTALLRGRPLPSVPAPPAAAWLPSSEIVESLAAEKDEEAALRTPARGPGRNAPGLLTRPGDGAQLFDVEAAEAGLAVVAVSLLLIPGAVT